MVNYDEIIRDCFIDWVKNAERTELCDQCLAIWLNQLGGLGATW